MHHALKQRNKRDDDSVQNHLAIARFLKLEQIG
jgi:hypothetical protein